jgi:hypothetical protein
MGELYGQMILKPVSPISIFETKQDDLPLHQLHEDKQYKQMPFLHLYHQDMFLHPTHLANSSSSSSSKEELLPPFLRHH